MDCGGLRGRERHFRLRELREQRKGEEQVQRVRRQWPEMQSKTGEVGNLMMLETQS